MIIKASTVGELLKKLEELNQETKIVAEIEVVSLKKLHEISFVELSVVEHVGKFFLKCVDQQRNSHYYAGASVWSINKFQAKEFSTRGEAIITLKYLL
jgi:hypothetical protein